MKRLLITITALLLGAGAIFDASAQLFAFRPFKKTVKLALVLPLNAGAEEPSRDCMDFYCGALMAIDAKKAEGVSVKLKVVDFSNADITAPSFAESIGGYDAVIGPFAAADLMKVLPHCRAAGVPLVSPLDQKAPDCSRYLKASSPMRSTDGGRVTLFYRSETETFTKDVASALERAGILYNKISYNVQRGRVITDSLRSVLAPSQKHHVIVASEDEAFASDVVRNMNLLKKHCEGLTIYASNRIRNFETIDADLPYSLGTHIATGYFVDYKDTATQNFVLKYRALYHAEPSQYAFSGYDIFYFFISALNDLQAAFREFVPYYTLNLLQSNILFRKVSDEGGYVNIRTRDVEYLPDFSIEVR